MYSKHDIDMRINDLNYPALFGVNGCTILQSYYHYIYYTIVFDNVHTADKTLARIIDLLCTVIIASSPLWPSG